MANCSQPQGIGSLASPCQGGCGERGPVVQKVIAARLTASAPGYANGAQIEIPMTGIPLIDPEGRYAHVVGFTIEGTQRFTAAGVTNDAVTPQKILQRLSAFFLRDVSGHLYLAGETDGRMLADDVFMRNLRAPGSLRTVNLAGNPESDWMGPGLGEDAGIGNHDVPFRLFFPFTKLDAYRPTLRGAIPLSGLVSPSNAPLQFTIQAPAATTGLTVGEFQGDLTVWLHLVYLPLVYIDSGWQLENYLMAELNATLRHADRIHEYVWNRPLPADAYDTEAYTGITIQTASTLLTKAQTWQQVVSRNRAFFESNLYARMEDDPFFGLIPNVPALNAYHIYVNSGRSVSAMPAGPVSYSFATRTDANTRFAHRTVLCQSVKRAVELGRAAFACDPNVQNVDARAYEDDLMTPAMPGNKAAVIVAVPKGYQARGGGCGCGCG